MIRLAAAFLALAVPTPETGFAPLNGAARGALAGIPCDAVELDDLRAEHGQLDYRSGGWWTADNLLVGFAPSEDSTICRV